MKKNINFVFQVEENGLYYAWAEKVPSCYNLVSELKRKNLITANVCDTMKEAEATADAWNEAHRRNGKYLFDRTPSRAAWLWAEYTNALIKKVPGGWQISTAYDEPQTLTLDELEKLARDELEEMAAALAAQGENHEDITRTLSAA